MPGFTMAAAVFWDPPEAFVWQHPRPEWTDDRQALRIYEMHGACARP